MTSRRIFLSVMVGLLTWPLSHRPAGALESIVIAYPTTSSQFAPLWFARDVGLYEKNGLDAKLVYTQGGSILIQAMLAGQVQAAQNGVAETVVAILRGGDVRLLGVSAKIFPYTLIGAKGVKSAKDLKGGKLAVNRLGDVSAIVSQVALRKLGLNPDKDVTMLQVGGSPQRLAALQSGSVQAAALDFMSALKLGKLGYNVLIQVSLNYPYLGPLVSGKFLRENPAAAEGFVRAFAEAIARFKKNREEGIKTISHYMKSNETELVTKAYEFIATEFYAESFEPDPKSFQDLLDELAEREPLVRKASMNQFFDMSVVRKLEKDGFFKALYKKQ